MGKHKKCHKIIHRLLDLLEANSESNNDGLECLVGFEIPDPDMDDIIDIELEDEDDQEVQVP